METSQPLGMQPAPRYRFLEKLGEGGMAEVFVGVSEQGANFRKLVVLKLLRTSLAEDSENLTMFVDEARLSARLSHRNVVQTYEVAQLGDRHAIVMEFLEGAPLGKLRRLAHGSKPRAGLPLAECVYVLCEALKGLHYAHELEDFDGTPLHFVHRDFTPGNVMVTLDGQVKVLDFGVSKTRANMAQTQTGMLKGTARYMPREALLGQQVDRRADVYMAGVVLWQLVTGARPWDDKQEIAVLAAILQQRLPPIRELDPALPAALEAIIYRATDPDPAHRHGTALELRDALLTFARSHGLSSDPDKLASVVQELVGAECRALRQHIDRQLAAPRVAPELMLANTLVSPSSPGAEGSASRVRPTYNPEATLSRLRRYPVLFAGGGLLSVCAGLAIALAFRGEAVRQSTSADIQLTLELPRQAQGTAPLHAGPTVQPAQELPAHAPEPTHERVTLRVEVAPREAELWLDGKRLSGNPATLEVERDQAVHQLRAQAPGYVPEVVLARFEEDTNVAVSLRKDDGALRRARHAVRDGKKVRGAASARPSPSGRSKAPAPSPTLPSVRPREELPARSIDTQSPWSR